ncbi:MAG: hypothetical protein MJK18_05740, partial [Bdellovibrionales bacterium]|nr:hypothetical protein [Bdellovibrionales bacterium]
MKKIILLFFILLTTQQLWAKSYCSNVFHKKAIYTQEQLSIYPSFGYHPQSVKEFKEALSERGIPYTSSFTPGREHRNRIFNHSFTPLLIREARRAESFEQAKELLTQIKELYELTSFHELIHSLSSDRKVPAVFKEGHLPIMLARLQSELTPAQKAELHDLMMSMAYPIRKGSQQPLSQIEALRIWWHALWPAKIILLGEVGVKEIYDNLKSDLKPMAYADLSPLYFKDP